MNAYDKEVMIRKKNHRKAKNYALHKLFLTGTLIAGIYSGLNLWEIHKFDKNVIKKIEVAANVVSVGSHNENELSMESKLLEARKNTHISKHRNPAIIWKTRVTDVPTLDILLDKSIKRSREIQMFEDSFETGKIDPNSPPWVKEAHYKINPRGFRRELKENGDNFNLRDKVIMGGLIEFCESEFNQRIANEYDALNRVVSGGTRMKAKNLSERHKSLLDTLKKAGGWRSIIRFQADDFKQAYADVFVGYLTSNMGDIDTGLQHLRKAKKTMDKYSDDKNLAIWRNTDELSQRTIKGLINSAIIEFDTLNKDESKYSSGWWKRLAYYSRSIGGQTDPSIYDVADNVVGRYKARGIYLGILGGISFFVAGKFGKRYKKSKEYWVEKE